MAHAERSRYIKGLCLYSKDALSEQQYRVGDVKMMKVGCCCILLSTAHFPGLATLCDRHAPCHLRLSELKGTCKKLLTNEHQTNHEENQKQ